MSDEFLGEIIRKAFPLAAPAAALARGVASVATNPTFGMVAAPVTQGLSLLPSVGAGLIGRRKAQQVAGKRAAESAAKIEAAESAAETAGKEMADMNRPAQGFTTSAEQQRINRLEGEMSQIQPDDMGVSGVNPQQETQRILQEMEKRPLPGQENPLDLEAAKVAQGQEKQFSELQSQQRASMEEATKLQAEADKAQAVHAENMKTQSRELTDQSLVGVQAVTQNAQRRAEADRERREQDEERAREAAGTGGATSTTSG